MVLERLQPQVEVRINGIARTPLGGSCTQGVRSAWPTSTLQLDPAEGKPSPGDLVEVFAGYTSTGSEIIFTGEIDVNGIDLAPNTIGVQATHILARMQEAVGAPPTIVDGEADQEYFLSWEGKTASEIIADLCDVYGLPNRTLEDSGRTFGNLEPVGLMAGDDGWSLVKQLDEVEGYQTFGAADGSVRRVAFVGIPSAGGRTFTQGTDLYAGRIDESRVNTRNRVIASGLPQIGTTGVDFVPTAERDAPSAWIPTPPGYRVLTFNSPLFETEDEADQYCARKLGEMNRLRGEMPFDLVTGDQTLRPAMSVGVDALRLDVRADVRFRVLEVVHSFDDGFHTSGTLLLASIGAGWSPNEAPIALIAASAKLEYLADGTQIVTVSLDGSASYDPELGVDGIVSYIWTGSPVTPTPLASGRRANAVYVGGIPDGVTITLTVTDDLGKTGSATIKPAAGGVKLKVRDLISAEKTRLQVSRDGGKTWVSVLVGASEIAAVGTCEFAAATYTFAWDSGGTLYKVLADNTATAVLSGASVTACGITLVNGNPDTPTGRVWAASSDGTVRRSRADGDVDTWEAVAALTNGMAATYILESAFAEGDVEAAAGNVYYRSFDNGGTWGAQYTHPNTALIAKRVASGFAKGFAGYFGGTSDDMGASRLVERDDAVTIDAPEPAKPISISGLAIDPYEDTIYVLDTDDGGLGRAWTGDGAVGGNLADTGAWDTVAWGVPRHMVRDGTAPGYLYISAVDALLKSVDGLATILELKLLGAGGSEGMMIGYGAEGVEPPPPAGDLTALAAPMAGAVWTVATPHLIRLTATGWVDLGAVPLTTLNAVPRLLKFGAGKYIAWDYTTSDSLAMVDLDNCVITTDDGATWQDAGLDGVISVAATDAGELYALAVDPHVSGSYYATVYFSADDGATWDPRGNYLHADTAVNLWVTQIGVHPTDAGKVALKTYGGVRVSTDGGLTAGTTIAPGQSSSNIHIGALLVAGDGVITWTSNTVTNTSTIRRLAFGAATATQLMPLVTSNDQPAIQRFGARLYICGSTVGFSTDDGATWDEILTGAQNAVPQAESALILSRAGAGNGAGTPYSGFWLSRSSLGTETDLTASQVSALGTAYRAWPGTTTN